MKSWTFILAVLLAFTMNLSGQTNHLLVDLAASAENDEAIRGFATNDMLSRTVGVHGKSDATDGQGVWGEGRTGVFAQGGDFGLFATGSFRAGFFSGDVEYTGALVGPMSDLRVKHILKSEHSYLDLIDRLNIIKFKYRTDEFPELGFTGRAQYGLVAQELEMILPELVYDSENGHLMTDSNNINEARLKSVNYVGLIPIALAGIQEMKERISSQEEQIEELKRELQLAIALLKELNQN